ncbi:hypothetical protein [Symbioplanes lichenis]|uniref:hypothetical protein n=1 Tax=Symbioplanes lichenis TaxID=1629072 RepID=UPI0027397464|nr:hypothetical protein [Actinoplanes lichenis]
MTRRLGAIVLGLAMALTGSGAAHAEAPKTPAKPTAVTIAGKNVSGGKLTVQQAEHADVFQRLLSEVNWLSTATPTTTAPKADKLGPKYVATVLIKDKATQVYDLYPLASGGPRAYRPAKQPTGKKSAGWFYGRLTMSESLRISGVPLEAKPDLVAGGIGGGIGSDVEAEELDPVAVGQDVVNEVQRLFLLNGAVLLVVLAGLAGVAFLIRRRV